ncbi:MAG: hypothetical protein Q9O62_11985 [Ardenticatenia bacterium]|nr:hypothetical protein [Ardenticatenia bacterium]
MHGVRIGHHIVVLWGGDRTPIDITLLGAIVIGYHLAGGHLLPSPEMATTATVARVVDGDTVVLDSGERVRLYGIDAPERRQLVRERRRRHASGV